MNDKCKIDGCENTVHVKSRGLCHKHYAAFWKESHENKTWNPIIKNKITGTCKIDGCKKEVYTVGMCKTHYFRTWRKERIEKINNGVVAVPDKKVCSKCREEKNIKEFHKHNGSSDGRASWCIKCARENPNLYYRKFPEKNKETCKKRYWNYHTENLIKSKEWRTKNKDRKRMMDKTYRGKNKDKLSKQHKEYYVKNSAHIISRSAAHHYKANYGLTKEDKINIYNGQDGKCSICGKEKTIADLAIDHCHHSSIVRGLLCKHCNMGLGLFHEDVKLMKKAIEYLDQHNFKFVHKRSKNEKATAQYICTVH